MRWHLEGGMWRVFLIPSTLLVVYASPSYAQVTNSAELLEDQTNLRSAVTHKILESQATAQNNTDSANSLLLLELPKNLIGQAPNPEGDPNDQRFPQPGSDLQPIPPENENKVQSEPETPTGETPTEETPTEETDTENPKIQVNKIEVVGSTVFKAEQFQELVKQVEGRAVTLEELSKVADAITQLYLDRGYLTSKAVVVTERGKTDDDIRYVTDGVAKIRIVEGSVEKIEVEFDEKSTKRLNPNYVRSRVALGIKKPLSTSDIEDQLRLLLLDPLFADVSASIRAGTKAGQNILVVRVKEANPFNAGVNIDNYSPPSIGSERFGINASYRNLTGLGDELAASYYFTPQGGSDIYDFIYRFPLNAMNGTLQLRTSINNNQVVQEPFNTFDIRGESQLYEVSFRQPLVRSLRKEFALSLGFTYQDGQTFTFAGPTPFGFGPDDDGNSRTRVIKFAQDYLARDPQGAWYMRSLFSFGIDIFDATKNEDPIPDGQFFSWLGQVQRVQKFSDIYTLLAQADIQVTPNGLLPSQQFVIGGGQSVRGYRQNARAADNGVRLSLEHQFTLQKDEKGNPLIKVAPFFDLGYVWNTDDNPNLLQKQTFLAGAGVGVFWQLLPSLNMRLDYGVPLVDLEDRGVNAQDSGFYFSVGYKL